jgi:hypothetical protein
MSKQSGLNKKAAAVSCGGFRHLRRAAPQMKPDPLPNPEL